MAYIDKINKDSTDYDLQDSKAARSVNGTTDSHVEQADEIYTTSTQVSTSGFVYRTTAGDVSIETGTASINYLEGNTVQTGHTDEVLNVQSSFMDSGTTVAIDASTWRTAVSTDGVYNFSYDGSDWKLDDATVILATYGLTVTGTVTEGDSITVNYVKLVIGTLATTTPVNFVSTGFNQYDATAGYAHVVGSNQYRIAGTYTSLGFTTTIGGATTPVTVTDSKFTPTEDGYIYVTGASGDILIALVWSGTMDSEPYSAYSTSTIVIPTADASSTALPTASYGMPSVGNVRDKLSFAEKIYVQNIGHYAYSAANLATVQALGVAYVYDLSDIFYVLPEPVTYTLDSSVSGTYTANDYGTEEFTGTTVPVNTSITYGNSLVDKLRNMLPIQSIGTGLTLTGTELSVSGGGGDSVYSTKTTSNNFDGGAIYIGNKNANQEAQEDPTATDMHYKYFWALPTGGAGSNSLIPANGTIDILGEVHSGNDYGVAIGFNSQLGNFAGGAVALGFQSKVRYNASDGIAIGKNIDVQGEHGIGIGGGNVMIGSSYPNCVAIGYAANCYSANCVALGKGAYPTRQGEVNVGCDNATAFNNTNYRVIGGVHDGQDAHDVTTVGQVNSVIDAINTALSTNIPHIGA